MTLKEKENEKTLTLKEKGDLLTQFINLLFDEGDEIWTRFIHDDQTIEFNKFNAVVAKSDLVEKSINKLIFKSLKGNNVFANTYNNRGYNVYFTVNSGGTTRAEIERFDKVNAVYGDADLNKFTQNFDSKEKAQQEREKRHKTNEFLVKSEEEEIHLINDKTFQLRLEYTEEKVIERKEKFLVKFKRELQDTTIVETKNGFHIYWVIEKAYKNRFAGDFQQVLEAIQARFDGWLDPKVNDIARVLRLPYFMHMKDANNPYLCKVIQWGKKWARHEIFNHLNLKEVYKEKPREEEKKQMRSGKKQIARSAHTRLEFKILAYQEKQTMSKGEFKSWIRRQPITDFVKNEELQDDHFHCFFHQDEKSPSANLFTDSEGIQLYICHGACTRKGRDIIDLYQATYGTKFEESLKKLAQIANVTIQRTEFEEQQYEKLRENRAFILEDVMNSERFDLMFNYLPKYLTYSRPLMLKFIVDFAEQQVMDSKISHNGEAIFFISMRHLGSRVKKGSTVTFNSVTLFSLLHLLNKVPLSEVPEKLQKRARMELEEAYHNEINFYTLPLFRDVLDEAEETAARLKANNFTIKNHLSKIGITKMFGVDEGERVFPNTEPVKEKSEIDQKVEDKILREIEKNGYVLQDTVIKAQYRLLNIKTQKREKVSVKFVEKVFKQIISNVCEEHGLEYVYLNKTYKERFNIKETGSRVRLIVKKH